MGAEAVEMIPAYGRNEEELLRQLPFILEVGGIGIHALFGVDTGKPQIVFYPVVTFNGAKTRSPNFLMAVFAAKGDGMVLIGR